MDSIEIERKRKEQQLLKALKKHGYENLDGWVVITTLSKKKNFYTRYVNNNTNLKARSIKYIINSTKIKYDTVKELELNISGKTCKTIDDNIIEEKICGICNENESDGYRFQCDHWHCFTCLSQYLKCDPDILLDHEYKMIVCPTCKSSNIRTLIELVELNQIHNDSKGIISLKSINDLSTMIVNLSLKGEEIYGCINKNCPGKWTLHDLSDTHYNKYEVKCPICQCHQCSKCSIPFNIHGFKCAEIKIDSKTALYLTENCVKCPGKCGQYIEKYGDTNNSINYCNVLKCYLDKIYVCGLCGEKLNSEEFNEKDNNHNLANIHFWEGPMSCRQHLFTSRKEWLKLKNK